MTKINRTKVARTSALLAVVLLLAVSASVNAIEIVEKKEWQNTLEAQGSFNYARREVFRELYGNGVTFAVRYEKIVNDKIGLGVRVSRVQLCNAKEYAIAKLKYRDFVFAPMITYNLAHSGGLRLFSGGGAGLSFRKITLESHFVYESGELGSPFEAAQSETSLYGLLMLGADIRLSSSLFLGARVTYDRHFFGDVTTGDLGDTGGFNFGGSLGFGF